MKNLYIYTLSLLLLFFGFTKNANACDNSSISLISQVDNGDGTITYTLDATIEIGGLDPTFYGFVLQFRSAYNTPSVISFSPSTLTTANLYNGSLAETLTGLIGNDVNSIAGDSDWNPYDNLTNVVSYEYGGFTGAATNDFSFIIAVTVSGCVEEIFFDSHVNSGSSDCKYTIATGQNCQCLAVAAPTATPNAICNAIGGNVTLNGNVTGTLGLNPTYTWAFDDPALNTLIVSPSSENTTINVPENFAGGTYPISFTYTDDNTCNFTANFNVIVQSIGQGDCVDPCDFYDDENVIINPGGNHNANAGYTQLYVLTDADSVIVATSTTGNFGIQTEGTYFAFAINYDNDDVPSPLPANGVDLGTIIGSGCMDVSPRLTIGVCEQCTDPIAQPTNIILSNETHTSFQIAWSDAVSDDVIIVIRETATANAVPADDISYVGSLVYGLGNEIGTGNYVVYSGAIGASPITVTGLSVNTSYTVSIYAANDVCILQPTPLVGVTTTSACVYPTTPPSAVTISDTTINTATLTWINGNGERTLITIRESSNPQIDPTDGITYNGNLNFGDGDEIGTGNFVVYSGVTGITTTTITGLSPNTAYIVHVYTVNSTGNCYSSEDDEPFTTPNSTSLATDTIYLCGGKLYDDGGPLGNYANGATIILTLLPDNPGDIVCLDFLSWEVSNARVKFYDGMSVSAPLIEDVTTDWTQTHVDAPYFKGPGALCSTSGALTVEFNPSGTDVGFEADVICHVPALDHPCRIEASISNMVVCSGEQVDLGATGLISLSPLENNFNDSTIGTGWSSTITPNFTNPCYSPFNGTTYFWTGIEPAPRSLATNTMDVSQGGTISFAFMHGKDDFLHPVEGAVPCEGADRSQESVFLEYSLDGLSWIQIRSFYEAENTFGSVKNTYGEWNYVTIPIPLQAQTASTQFRWHQYVATSNNDDSWGLDEIKITTFPTSTISWDNGLGVGNNKTDNPTEATTYIATISDGTTSCQASVSVAMCTPVSINTMSFNGVCTGENVELNWEGINSYEEGDYIIERASDNLKFDEIATVPKNNFDPRFNYKDEVIDDNNYFYRIRVRSFELGINIYSNIIGPLGNCNKNLYGIHDSYYNFNTEEIVLRYNFKQNTNVNFKLYDLSGRLIFQKNVEFTSDKNTISIKPLFIKGSSIYIINAISELGVYNNKVNIPHK